MDITNPRRILCLGGPDSGVLSLLQDLTGSAPTPKYVSDSQNITLDSESPTSSESTPPRPSTAGLSHTLVIRTKYYAADIPIWLDEFSPSPSLSTEPSSEIDSPNSTRLSLGSIDAWESDFLRAEAGEVVRAIGAWIFVFRSGASPEHVQQALEAIKAVIAEAHEGDYDMWDGICLAVCMPSGVVGNTGSSETTEESWDNLSLDYGFEYIEYTASSHKAVEEERREKVGVSRIKEALETCDWTSNDEEVDFALEGVDDEKTGDNSDGDDRFLEGVGFGQERREMEREFMGFKLAINGLDESEEFEDSQDEALQVEQLESMMQRMQAVKDMSAHMSLAERKRFASKAVDDLMKSVRD